MEEEIGLSERTNSSKRKIGRAFSINGVHAVDVNLNKASNLDDPILDLNIKVNNPVGRLWLAIRRLWKSQNTVVALRFTIPLLVLPIALYVGWRLWQGRGVMTPMSKLGVVHEVVVAGKTQDILILPTSDVYLLSYSAGFNSDHRLLEKPVIVIGTYSHLSNTLSVEDLLAYNAVDIPPSSSPLTPPSLWESVLRFIEQFK